MTDRPRVLVKEKIGDSGVKLLRDAGLDVELGLDWADGQLDARIGEFDAILIRSATKLTAEVYHSVAPTLHWNYYAKVGREHKFAEVREADLSPMAGNAGGQAAVFGNPPGRHGENAHGTFRSPGMRSVVAFSIRRAFAIKTAFGVRKFIVRLAAVCKRNDEVH